MPSIQPGARLGPYEIVSRLGAGGMGEVWHARDTRLDRDVAVKTLSGHFAANAQLKIRFEREAKTISQLSHPNICTLFDVGDDFLVMELLEGESVADRVARGPMPLPDVLRYGAQIAEALHRAHRAGVVHRDLKPANVMITKSGAKLLDFGLAKSATIDIVADGATMQKPLTTEGTILGTFQYMAPEQLEGLEADARCDIFALGALLHEMATGQRAFEGKTKTSLIAAIVGSMPKPVSEIVPVSPAALDHVIAKCLAKDREERWQSAHDVAEELKWIATAPMSGGAAAGAIAQRPRRGFAALAAVMSAVAIIATIAAVRAMTRPRPTSRVMRFAAPMITAQPTRVYGVAAISPDGKRIVYSSSSAGTRMLFQRMADQLESKPIPGTEEAVQPFFSPDGKWLAFFAHHKLMKVSAAGGQPIALATAAFSRGGAWRDDDTIVFCPFLYGGIERVSSAGGTPQVVSRIDRAAGERAHRWPRALPGSKAILYSVLGAGTWDDATVVAQDLDTGERKVILKSGCDARYLPTGHLVYVRGNALYAIAFDLKKLETRGEPVEIVQGIANHMAGGAEYAFSDDGLLIYLSPGVGTDEGGHLSILDRHGKNMSSTARLPPHAVSNPRFSPDGTKMTGDHQYEVWTFDLVRGTGTRVSPPGARTNTPVWSRDGSRIYYGSERKGPWQIFSRASDASDQERPLSPVESVIPFDVSPDGRELSVEIVRKETGADVAIMSGDGRLRDLVQGDADETEGLFSPDGKWIVYTSDESGRREIYVRSTSGTPGRWQISTDGGSNAKWITPGEILYLKPGKMMTVSVKTEPAFTAGTPELLFEHNIAAYDVARDGRILITEGPDPSKASGQMNVVINWFEDVKARMR
jgi:eukaryotic-like serine/threonine-protein kinase